MLVKTPAKKKKAKPNRRRPSTKKKKTGSKVSKNGTSKKYGKKRKKTGKQFSSLNKIRPWKIILGIIAAGIFGMLYLKHVFTTQELLAEVEQLEQHYQQVKRKHDRYRLTYDRIIGPKEIYDKAKAAGFIDGGPAEKVIEVKPVE